MGDSTYLPPNVGNKGTLHAQGTVNNIQHSRMDHKKYEYYILLFIFIYLLHFIDVKIYET